MPPSRPATTLTTQPHPSSPPSPTIPPSTPSRLSHQHPRQRGHDQECKGVFQRIPPGRSDRCPPGGTSLRTGQASTVTGCKAGVVASGLHPPPLLGVVAILQPFNLLTTTRSSAPLAHRYPQHDGSRWSGRRRCLGAVPTRPSTGPAECGAFQSDARLHDGGSERNRTRPALDARYDVGRLNNSHRAVPSMVTHPRCVGLGGRADRSVG